MPPNLISTSLISYTRKTSILLVCCNPFGFRMAKSVLPEPHSSTSVGKSNIGAMIAGRMAPLAMDWLRKCWHLWQNFPANLMAAILAGIVQWAMPTLKKTVELLEAEDCEGGESQMETQNLKGSHLEYLIWNGCGRYRLRETDCLVEDDYFEEPLFDFEHAEMDQMHLEEEGISELCLMSPSIFWDFGNYWEGSTKEDFAQEDVKRLDAISRKCLENSCHAQMASKIADYVGKNQEGDCSHHEELKDFEDVLWQRVESTSVSQEEKDQLLNEDLAMCEEEQILPSSKVGEPLEMNKEGGNESDTNVEPTTAPLGFKSSLVLSLFYSPSEEEEDEDEDDDSEDWWDEDEMNANTLTDNSNSANGVAQSEAEDDPLQRNDLENLCGSFSRNSDPFHPLCFSKPVKTHKLLTSAPPEPKKHQEISVSFYLTRQDSQLEQLCGPSKQPWPQKIPKTTHRSSSHKCCQPDSRRSYDTVTSGTSSISQEENQVTKRVRFSPVVTIHSLVVWDYASRAARRGPWEEMARDRCRFRRRIAEVGTILEPCLKVEHRAKMWRKIRGVLDSAQKEDNTNVPLLPSLAEMKKLGQQNSE